VHRTTHLAGKACYSVVQTVGVTDAQLIDTARIDTVDVAPVETDDATVLADLLVEEVSIDGMCGVY
jgi:mycofactocin precursor